MHRFVFRFVSLSTSTNFKKSAYLFATSLFSLALMSTNFKFRTSSSETFNDSYMYNLHFLFHQWQFKASLTKPLGLLSLQLTGLLQTCWLSGRMLSGMSDMS